MVGEDLSSTWLRNYHALVRAPEVLLASSHNAKLADLSMMLQQRGGGRFGRDIDRPGYPDKSGYPEQEEIDCPEQQFIPDTVNWVKHEGNESWGTDLLQESGEQSRRVGPAGQVGVAQFFTVERGNSLGAVQHRSWL